MLIGQFELLIHPSGEPAARQVAQALRQGIIHKQISLGAQLPSVREFAKGLDISRSTVARAIDELVSQGYVVSAMGSCSRVAECLPGESDCLPGASKFLRGDSAGLPGDAPGLRCDSASLSGESVCVSGRMADCKSMHQLSAFAQRLATRAAVGAISTNIHYSGPLLRDLPLNIWRTLLGRHCRKTGESDNHYSPDAFGYLPLRQAYASYLERARAVRVSEERLATFASRNLRIDLLARLLLNAGDIVAMEEPGFPAGREQFLAAGARIASIGVDSQGLVVEQLYSLPVTPRLIYVTPSHQAPTGAVMSLKRRSQLLAYAASHDCYIVEDDYDSEFRYDGRPLASLQGMDKNDKTIYLSCLWNVLAPVTRIGFMIVPEALVAPMAAAKSLVERDFSLVEQAALTDFINEGHLERLIRRHRTRNAELRKNLLYHLQDAFGAELWKAPESAGLDLMVRFSQRYTAEQVEHAAFLSGMPMISSRGFYQGEPRPLEYIISFAALAQDEMDARLQKFVSLMLL